MIRNVLLSGGAIKGVVNHLAFLSAYDVMISQEPSELYIYGTSAGALVGSLYAKYGSDHIPEIIEDLKDIFSYWNFVRSIKYQGNPFKTDISILKHDIFRKKLNEKLPQQFSDLRHPFGCYAVDVNVGKSVYFGSDFPTLSVGDAVFASMLFPGAFRPIVLKGDRLIDGGVLMNIPYRDIAQKIMRSNVQDEYLIVDVSPNWIKHEYEYSIVALFDITRNFIEDDLYTKIIKEHPNAALIPGNMIDLKYKSSILGALTPWGYNKYMDYLVKEATDKQNIEYYKQFIVSFKFR